jgi:uncharacterized membrane protein YkoI
MSSTARFVIVAAFTTALVPGLAPLLGPARGEDTPRPARVEETAHPAAADAGHEAGYEIGHEAGYACLDQRERRAEAGKFVPLVAAMRVARARMPGTVVRARLCRGPDGLVYVLTVLARDGKVARITVDAVKGTLVGGL